LRQPGGAIDAVEDYGDEIIGITRPEYRVAEKARIVAIFAALSEWSMAGGAIALKQLGTRWVALSGSNSVLTSQQAEIG
jgi:hypothetical protein